MKTTTIFTFTLLTLGLLFFTACKIIAIVGPLDHFLVYDIDDISIYCEEAELKGIFDSDWKKYDVTSLSYFTNPTWKRHNDRVYKIVSEDHHLNWYTLESKPEKERRIEISNQFGHQKMTLGNPKFLLVPTAKVRLKEVMPMPEDLDHYKVYEVLSYVGFDGVNLMVGDQFSDKMKAFVIEPKYFAIPTMKQHRSTFARILKENEYITFYSIDPGSGEKDAPDYLMTNDQFCGTLINVNRPKYLGVPTKMSTEIPPSKTLGEHFLVYNVDDLKVDPEQTVELETRYDHITCRITELSYFVNPVEKTHKGDTFGIVDESAHANLYYLNQVPRTEPHTFNVVNQFGSLVINLHQPSILFVPTGKEVETRKEKYDIPDSLNHYLLYKVEGVTPPQDVLLSDQFVTGMSAHVQKPVYYGVPVKKTHNGKVCEIFDEGQDLLFYEIIPEFNSRGIPKTHIEDQFMPAKTPLDHFVPVYLAVPTSLISK